LEIGTAHALQTRRISTHAARELVIRSKALVDDETDISLARAVDEKEGYANLELDDLNLSSDGSVDSAEEDDGSELEVDQKLTQVSEFLLNSQAYASLKSRLLDFAHRTYDMRISMAIGDTVVGQSGDILCPDSLRLITKEISWVPTHLLTFEGLNTLLDRFKGAVEDRMKEKLNWWPLGARTHAFREGFCRLHWKTPRSTSQHVDVLRETPGCSASYFRLGSSFLGSIVGPLSSNHRTNQRQVQYWGAIQTQLLPPASWQAHQRLEATANSLLERGTQQWLPAVRQHALSRC
jgi:hypothetical protein